MIVHISLSMRLCRITFVQILTISLDSVSGKKWKFLVVSGLFKFHQVRSRD